MVLTINLFLQILFFIFLWKTYLNFSKSKKISLEAIISQLLINHCLKNVLLNFLTSKKSRNESILKAFQKHNFELYKIFMSHFNMHEFSPNNTCILTLIRRKPQNYSINYTSIASGNRFSSMLNSSPFDSSMCTWHSSSPFLSLFKYIIKYYCRNVSNDIWSI